ncbi:MAG: hypothetical protein OEM59_03880 [Rhodospirillales bacterium]|nr:hypothetical protein [Rhodospirillales bacterium]
MAIKYVSEHDSPDDPGGLIKQALDMGPEFPGPAEDILLAWMLRLGADHDAVAAAGRLIETYGIAEGPVPADATGKLVELLRQTAQCPPERLGDELRRRRGGPRRHER